jgi:DNA-binding NarL/FixJ family response regulator
MVSQYLCSEAVLLHVEKAQELGPDVALMDISRPATNRSELTRQLRKILPAIRA